jgi:hypothetical protein
MLLHKLLFGFLLLLTINSAWASGATISGEAVIVIALAVIFISSMICSTIVLMANPHVRGVVSFFKYFLRIFVLTILTFSLWVGLMFVLDFFVNGAKEYSGFGLLYCWLVGLIESILHASKSKVIAISANTFQA